MSSDFAHSTVSYTSISSQTRSWSIPTMDPYEEVAQQGQTAPLSPAYVHDPMELEHHIPVYVLEPDYPEYLASSDDDIPIEDQPLHADASPVALSSGYVVDFDLEEDLIDYAADADDNEEESFEDDDYEEEEHLLLPTLLLLLLQLLILSLLLKRQTPKPFPSEAEVTRLLALPTSPPSPLTPLSSTLPHIPSPPLPLPSPPTHTSPTYTEAPLGYRAAEIQLRAASPLPLPAPSTSRRADIPEANILPQKRWCLTTPTPRFEVGESSAARQPGPTVARRVDYSFVDTMDASIRASKRKIMAAIEVVNLRVSYQADVRRRESEEFYTQHQDAQGDRAALHDEVDTLRRYLSFLCTTYEQERVEARLALDRSEAHNRALEAHIAVLETHAYCHEWQRQDADDRGTGHIMRIQALKARARVDTLEDTGSSA
ncbi:hypothetical protein Tco_1261042, partial [Tanacetum coccineum]